MNSSSIKKSNKRGQRKNRQNKRTDPLGNIPRYAVNSRRVDEVKTLDYSNSSLVISDSGNAVLCNSCIQGTDSVNQRIGRKILMRRIQARFTAGAPVASLTGSTGLTNNADVIRAVLVYDKQSNGAGASWSSIFNASGVANAPLAFRSQATQDRYIVLADYVTRINTSGPNMFQHEFDVPCSLEVSFTSTNNGDITDIITGGVYFIIVDANTTGNLPSTFNLASRVEFVDA